MLFISIAYNHKSNAVQNHLFVTQCKTAI